MNFTISLVTRIIQAGYSTTDQFMTNGASFLIVLWQLILNRNGSQHNISLHDIENHKKSSLLIIRYFFLILHYTDEKSIWMINHGKRMLYFGKNPVNERYILAKTPCVLVFVARCTITACVWNSKVLDTSWNKLKEKVA